MAFGTPEGAGSSSFISPKASRTLHLWIDLPNSKEKYPFRKSPSLELFSIGGSTPLTITTDQGAQFECVRFLKLVNLTVERHGRMYAYNSFFMRTEEALAPPAISACTQPPHHFKDHLQASQAEILSGNTQHSR